MPANNINNTVIIIIITGAWLLQTLVYLVDRKEREIENRMIMNMSTRTGRRRCYIVE